MYKDLFDIVYRLKLLRVKISEGFLSSLKNFYLDSSS